VTLVSPHRLTRAAAVGLAAAMAAAMFAAPVAAASPAGLYVSHAHGMDSNLCTNSQPCLTISHAVAVAAPGATIHVDQGTYAEQVSITKKVILTGQG
jgi:hypothetical protein